jgi:hypothetical protein
VKHFAVSCLLILGFVVLCSAQIAKNAPPVDVAIHAGKVLDVRTGKYVSDRASDR